MMMKKIRNLIFKRPNTPPKAGMKAYLEKTSPPGVILRTKLLDKFIIYLLAISLILTFLPVKTFAQDSTAQTDSQEVSAEDPAELTNEIYGEDDPGDPVTQIIGQINQLINLLDGSLATFVDELKQKKIVLSGYDQRELKKYLTILNALETNAEAKKLYDDKKVFTGQFLLDLGIEASRDNKPIEISQQYTLEQVAQQYDIRTIRLLNYLVTPKEQGGAGHERIRVKRIAYGYQKDDKATSRESPGDTPDEEPQTMSAHHTGQAVDISEIDYLKCTLIKKRRIGGSKLVPQKPRPIKVMWQSEEGMAQDPSIQLSSVLDQLLRDLALGDFGAIFLENGKIDTRALGELVYMVGESVIEDELDLEEGALKRLRTQNCQLSGDAQMDWNATYKNLGKAILAKNLGLDDPAILSADSLEGIGINLVTSYIEHQLDLPAGSIIINSDGLGPTMDNIARRRLEKILDLPSCTLASPGQTIDWSQIENALNDKYEVYRQLDDALGLPGVDDGLPSSSQRLRNKDQKVLWVIGAAVLADGLGYDVNQKREFLQTVNNAASTGQLAVRLHYQGQSWQYTLTEEQVDKILQGKKDEKRQTSEVSGATALDAHLNNPDLMKNLDEEVAEALSAINNIPEQVQTRDDLKLILANKDKYERLALLLAAKRMEKNLNLPANSLLYTYVRDGNESRLKENIGQARLEEVLKLPQNSLGSHIEILRSDLYGEEIKGPLTKGSVVTLQKAWSDNLKAVADVKNPSHPEEVVPAEIRNPFLQTFTIKNKQFILPANVPAGLVVVVRCFESQEDASLTDEAIKLKIKTAMGQNGLTAEGLDQILHLPGPVQGETQPGTTANFLSNNQVSVQQYKEAVGGEVLKLSASLELMDMFDLSIGNYKLTQEDVVGFLSGRWEQITLKIASRAVEEELGLPAGSFALLMDKTKTPEEKALIWGGMFVGEAIGLTSLNLEGINNVGDFTQRVGQQRIEEFTGFPTGKFTGTIADIKAVYGDQKLSSIISQQEKEQFDNWGIYTAQMDQKIKNFLGEENYKKYLQPIVQPLLDNKQKADEPTRQKIRAAVGYSRWKEVFIDGQARLDKAFNLVKDRTALFIGGGADDPSVVNSYIKDVGTNLLTSEAIKAMRIDDYLNIDLAGDYEIKGSDLVYSIQHDCWRSLSSTTANCRGILDIITSSGGLVLDQQLGWEAGTGKTFIDDWDNPEEQMKIVIKQGLQKLSERLGLQGDGLKVMRAIVLSGTVSGEFDACLMRGDCSEWLAKGITVETGIPYDDTKPLVSQDINSFITGDWKQAFTYWGIAAFVQHWQKDAEGAPSGVTLDLTYEEVRTAFYGDRNYAPGASTDPQNPNYSPELDYINQERTDFANTKCQGLTGTEAQDCATQAFQEWNQNEDRNVEQARRDFRRELMENISYKILDYQMQKIDPKIPKGFAQAIIKGTPEQRNTMLLTYLNNLVLASLLPQQYVTVLSPILTRVMMGEKITDADITALSGFFSWLDGEGANKIFGFKLQPGTFEAIFRYTQTGDLSKLGNDLQAAYQDWALSKVFSWADKELGFNPGTARALYNAYTTYQSATQAYRAGQITSSQLNAQMVNVYAMVATIVFGKQIGQLEQKWGMVPGTLSMLITGIATGNLVQIGLAIVMSLFGVYKVEMQCAVDYYPRAGGDYNKKRREEAQKDPNHPPAFNGIDAEAYRKNIVIASQYKVRQLLGDLLDMPDNMKKNGQISSRTEMKPQQIITMRWEDVESLVDKLKNLYGNADKRGQGVWVVGERQGMWATGRPEIIEGQVKFPQMWESIHVGY